MLIQLESKQRKIALVTLSLFMGSWLLLLCQICFASLQDTDSTSYSQEETVIPCHTIDSGTEKLKGQCNPDDDNCSGVCDRDKMTAALNSVEKTGHSDKFHKLSIDSFPASVSFKDKIAINLALTRYRLPFPERAILLPQQRYVVFLI